MKVKISLLFALLMASAVMGSGVGYSKLYLFHIVLVGIFLSCLLVVGGGSKLSSFKITNEKSLWIFYLMFIWYAFSTLWSINPLYSVQYLFYIFIGFAIVLLMNFYIVDLHKFLDVFGVLKFFFVLALLIALLEAFTPFRLPTSPYSDYAVIFGRKGTDFIEFESEVQALIRTAPTSFWGNPNNMAVAMVLMLPFFLLCNRHVYKYAGVLAIFIVIVMAGSRGVFISFVFCLFAYLIIKNSLNIFFIFFIASASVIFAPSLIDSLKNSDNHRISEIAGTGEVLYTYLFQNDDSSGSIGVRQQLISNGMEALWESNGLGVGGGGSLEVQERLGGVGGKEVGSMHNFWVEILVDAGVLFFVLFMTWYFVIIWKLYKIYKKTKEIIYRYQAGALCIAMLIFLIAAVSASSVIYFFPMWLMFGMSTSLIRIYSAQRL
jgi:teichuronic acid biosynthesis protein TuaE